MCFKNILEIISTKFCLAMEVKKKILKSIAVTYSICVEQKPGKG